MNPVTGFKDFIQFQIAFENGSMENPTDSVRNQVPYARKGALCAQNRDIQL